MARILLVLLLTAATCRVGVGAEPAGDDLRVLGPAFDGVPVKQMLSRHLRRLAYEAFAKRTAEYEALKTADQIAEYQRRRREFFIAQLGGFPERTPLRPQVVGMLEGDGYRIEKVIFESRPRHFVTALLYLPLQPPPHPGVIVPCGHTSNGKTGYQQICILLARNGIAALCYDPIGQGERYQILDSGGKPQFKSTDEHTLVGIGSILVGWNTASYRVWDGIRALDYLASRPEIDPQRLGCTGNSGGGTLTEYLMAVDPRIQCAAPSCCITTFQRRLETNTLGDAEQNIFGQIAFGLDHADYTLLHAPRPTLLCTATHDFVDIEGAWHIFREAKRLYARTGFSERVDLIEVDGKHGFSQPKREAAVRWMRRWLLEKDDAISEAPCQPVSHEKLLCTPRGQAQLLSEALSVVDLNVSRMDELAPQRQELWQPAHRTRAVQEVRRLAGIRQLADLPKPQVTHVGTVERAGYQIDKQIVRLPGEIDLAALLFRPAQPAKGRVLYLHGEGKHVDAAAGGAIERLVRDGNLVMAVDLRSAGETGGATAGLWGGNWEDMILSYLLGRTMVGMRAEDILVCARHLSAAEGSEPNGTVALVAQGQTGPPALHAAVLEPQLFQRVTLVDSILSWQDVVRQQVPRGQLINVVHGALEKYDLSDLIAVLREAGKMPAEQP